jgi:ribosome recycling factor
MSSSEYKVMEGKMNKTLDVLHDEFNSVRAGRANPAILDHINVDYYGVPTPIKQMANVSVPEARMMVIQPWDTSILKDIEKAILTSDLGINPGNDGKIIRLTFPTLTEERRKELIKQIKKYGEEAKIAIRSIRRDTIDKYKKMEKKSEITEDDLKDSEKEIQKITDDHIKKVDEMVHLKEEELMEV